MDFRDDTHQPLSEINIIPFVDVMLVLLILFIITAPLLTVHLIKIDLPKVSHLVDHSHHNDIIDLAMNEKGMIFWNGESIDRQELIQRLTLAAQRVPQAQLHLRASKMLQYQHLTEVMAVIQHVGITQISFVTEPIK